MSDTTVNGLPIKVDAAIDNLLHELSNADKLDDLYALRRVPLFSRYTEDIENWIRSSNWDRFDEMVAEDTTVSAEWYRVQFAWDRYQIKWFYNNPNAPYQPTHVLEIEGKWYIVRPDNGERVFAGNTPDEAVEMINSSSAADGVRVTKVEATNYLIRGGK